MPTGYTAKISEGQNFEDFILGCARAFGACVMMRDESGNKLIPEKFEESSHHKEEYNKACIELKKYEIMSEKDINKKAIKDYNQQLKNQKEHLEKIDKQEKLYESMLENVNKWTPPTSGHIGLKNFMIQQIDISMDCGCMKKYYSKENSIKLSGEQWRHKKIKSIERSIEYHMEEWNKETKRINDNNIWIKELRDSIKK